MSLSDAAASLRRAPLVDILGWKPLSLIRPLTGSRWVSSSGCCKCCINIVKISLTLHKRNPRPTLNKKTRLYETNEITFFDSIHYILRKKTQIYNKKFLSDKLSVTKSTLFFSLASFNSSHFYFNLRFLHELKHMFHHFFKSVWMIFYFWFCLVFTKVYIFVWQKVWTPWFKKASTKNCESVKKGKFVTKILFQIMLNEVLKSCEKWYQPM